MSSLPSSTVIEVFADVSCPFTQAGLHRWIARRAEAGRSDVGLRVRAWPLEIVNGLPLTGEAITAKVAALAAVYPDQFAGFAPDSFPSSTLPALQLTNAAYRVDVATGELVAMALRDLLFVEGRDVSDPDVLAEVSHRHDIPVPDAEDAAAVLADLDEGRRRGVVGSPHYFGPGFDAFCPGLDIAHVGDELAIAASADKFDSFMDRCFPDTPV